MKLQVSAPTQWNSFLSKIKGDDEYGVCQQLRAGVKKPKTTLIINSRLNRAGFAGG